MCELVLKDIDRAPNDTFSGEDKKEGQTGGWLRLNTNPTSEQVSLQCNQKGMY